VAGGVPQRRYKFETAETTEGGTEGTNKKRTKRGEQPGEVPLKRRSTSARPGVDSIHFLDNPNTRPRPMLAESRFSALPPGRGGGSERGGEVSQYEKPRVYVTCTCTRACDRALRGRVRERIRTERSEPGVRRRGGGRATPNTAISGNVRSLGWRGYRVPDRIRGHKFGISASAGKAAPKLESRYPRIALKRRPYLIPGSVSRHWPDRDRTSGGAGSFPTLAKNYYPPVIVIWHRRRAPAHPRRKFPLS
jgi:hypothetical protein